jgi:hypothetical protein
MRMRLQLVEVVEVLIPQSQLVHPLPLQPLNVMHEEANVPMIRERAANCPRIPIRPSTSRSSRPPPSDVMRTPSNRDTTFR